MTLTEKLEGLLTKEARELKTLQFALQLPDQDLTYAYSSTGQLQQRFHSASVGKLLTAALVFMAAEEGLLDLTSKAADYLGRERLKGLFQVDGRDYQEQVTVRQLLGHTSGINDYYSSSDMGSSPFIEAVLKEPDRFWTPEALLDYTRRQQTAVGAPGQQFYYSDTGYVLLGLLLETVFGTPFHQLLEEKIFRPCQMTQTSLAFYGQNFDAGQLAPFYVNGRDIHLYRSLSCDFSGGGLSTTSPDLCRFLQALWQGQLLSRDALNQMAVFAYKFQQGLHYGLGMMQVRFSEFSFFLRRLPSLQGHAGVTGAHAWYDPRTGASYALNVGDSRDMEKSFRLLIKLLQLVAAETKG